VISYVLFTIYIIACVILILVVLLQPGKGDVASALGGGTTGAAFGPRGATTLLAKVTIIAAIAFMALAFLFSVPGIITPRSVTSGLEVPMTPPPASDGTPAQEPGAGDAVPAGTLEVTPEGGIDTEAPGQPGTTAPAPDAPPATPPAEPNKQ
jgi:preprotein translocase subunit SecG